MGSSKIQAEPHAFDFDVKSTALVMIDMKRRFVEPAGRAEWLRNNVAMLRDSIEPYSQRAGYSARSRTGRRITDSRLQPGGS